MPDTTLKRLRTLADQLSDAETQLEMFFELAIDLLAIADKRGFFIRLSKSWEETLGWTRQELMEQGYIHFVHPDDRNKTFEAEQYLKIGELDFKFNFINRYQHKDGHYISLAWRASQANDHGHIYAVARVIEDDDRI